MSSRPRHILKQTRAVPVVPSIDGAFRLSISPAQTSPPACEADTGHGPGASTSLGGRRASVRRSRTPGQGEVLFASPRTIYRATSPPGADPAAR